MASSTEPPRHLAHLAHDGRPADPAPGGAPDAGRSERAGRGPAWLTPPRRGAADPPAPPGGRSPLDGSVWVEVPVGWWRLSKVADALGRRFAAELTTAGGAGGDRSVVWSTRQPTFWRLEEMLGWAVPLRVQRLLTTFPPPPVEHPPGAGPDLDPSTGLPGGAGLIDRTAGSSAFRPWRASRVGLGGGGTVSYGRLVHDEHPIRTWTHGDLRVELLTGPGSGAASPGLTAYRILDGEAVVFAGEDARGQLTARPTVEDALRGVLALPDVLRHTPALTSRQRTFITRHAATLAAAAQPPAHPYRAGTRVRAVTHTGEPEGTVRGVVPGPDGHTRPVAYLWRPDLADRPGHPWSIYPGWTLQTATDELSATLGTEPPPRGLAGREPPAATGALVRALDDPRFTVGTVLRALTGRGHRLSYEVQPHDAPIGPVVLPDSAVTVVRPAGWCTVDDLLNARRLAGLDVQPGEVLPTAAELGLAVAGPHGLTVDQYAPGPNPPSDLTDGAQPLDLTDDRPTRPRRVHSSRRVGELREIDDPLCGRLVVRESDFQAARSLGPDRLADLLSYRPWLPAADLPVDVAAALAVLHARDDLPPSHPTAPDTPPSTDHDATAGAPPREPGMVNHPAGRSAAARPASPPGAEPDRPPNAYPPAPPEPPAFDGP
ncbi:hypothetical protein [Pseudofrankia sp. BMG5.37]|uniref:hypothetical protein n=1 Tax=Pseudofrankia sp. BMG5.37 TaxID=3050035 RepID=UPI0028958741|nr:hypothetical protein [Pseudofrankia sp. BMG5.37]MDT3444448.1 hypothetical protein [Pseudofrankia sp. BMG5.37]